MPIYIASRKLKIESSLNIKLLNSKNIQEVTQDDIVISTGTVRDDLMLKILIDRGVLPFVVTYSKKPLNSFLINLSLFISKKVEIVTTELIEESRKLQRDFSNLDKILEDERILTTLLLYQQTQLFNFSQKAFKSEQSSIKQQSIYIDKKKELKGVSRIYATLQDSSGLRVLKLEGESKIGEEEFITNQIKSNFKELMQGEEILFKNRKFFFNYKEITSQYKKEFLLFGIDNLNDFQSYKLYNPESKEEFNNIGVYEIDKEVKNINTQALLALSTLKNLLNYKEANILNLDTFLLSTHSFKRAILTIKHEYKNCFKKSIISDILSKLYDNITEDKYQKSNLRYAIVLLKSQPLELINENIQSHIFYDIQNGINVNNLILQESIGSIKKNYFNEKPIEETIDIDPKESEIEDFIKNSDIRKFIKLFLNTLLAMDSTTNIEMDKTLHFVSLFIYLAFEKELKTTIKDGKERFQIDHCYMMFTENQIKNNRNEFFGYIDDFINEDIYPKSIESYLLEYISYKCIQNTKEITLHIQNRQFQEKKENLRKQNSRFSKKLMVVGLFYQSITQKKRLDEIISLTFKHIKEESISISKQCKENISFKFLALFFQGHGKKNCHQNLEAFFEEAKYFLEEN